MGIRFRGEDSFLGCGYVRGWGSYFEGVQYSICVLGVFSLFLLGKKMVIEFGEWEDRGLFNAVCYLGA